jgi:hypothetical protein
MGGTRQVIIGHTVWSPSESFTFPARSGDASVNALPNPLALEFREATQDAQHEPPSGAARVDTFTEDMKPTPASVSV